ncbi:MAG: hypothetical protein ACJAW8_002668 [Oleispira sp.]|jgi:hypothetical protein
MSIFRIISNIQYTLVLLVVITETLTIFQEFFNHFKQKPSLANSDTLPHNGAS